MPAKPASPSWHGWRLNISLQGQSTPVHRAVVVQLGSGKTASVSRKNGRQSETPPSFWRGKCSNSVSSSSIWPRFWDLSGQKILWIFDLQIGIGRCDRTICPAEHALRKRRSERAVIGGIAPRSGVCGVARSSHRLWAKKRLARACGAECLDPGGPARTSMRGENGQLCREGRLATGIHPHRYAASQSDITGRPRAWRAFSDGRELRAVTRRFTPKPCQ